MAKASTTLSGAITRDQTSIAIASATGVAANMVGVINGSEQIKVVQGYVSGTTVNVLRGIGGTVARAHPSGASVTFGLASDFDAPAPGDSPVNWPNVRSRVIKSYTADGAIEHPASGSDMVAILNGTTQWDMTLAAPAVDLTGSCLTIIGDGKSAHTVTVAGGIGTAGTGYTVLTFDTGGLCCVSLMAAKGSWVPYPSPLSGTLTAVDVAVS